MASSRISVLALSGGVGGAKLALGLRNVLPAGELAIVANTGDDFDHLGLFVSPDIDTLLYTLGGLSDTSKGWGRADETWSFMEAVRQAGGEDWFLLGDRDLATHVLRTQMLAGGRTLSETTAHFADRFGAGATILPMTDDRVATRVLTPVGWLAFQHYFVRERCVPAVSRIEFDGAERASLNPDVSKLLATRLDAIVICPSNPFLSVDPILAVPGMREAIRSNGAPVIAVSPIIAGQAVKGPTAKLFAELGLTASAANVARHYAGLIDGFVLDEQDAGTELPHAMAGRTAQTLMQSLEDRENLARVVLDFAGSIGRRR
jgi:LPPG:FO 2-phospho-L-lactate transferase